MKRLVTDGLCYSFPRTKDQCYCYGLKGYNPKNQKVDHQLKIVDTFIEFGMPDQCLIEPQLGSYEPDLFYKDHFNRSVCVEVQLTRISHKRMQEKINHFIKEEGVNHDARLFIIVSHFKFDSFHYDQTKYKVIQKEMPKEITL